jgi:S1-C subfamily serine protease
MNTTTENNLLVTLSEGLADAVEKGGASTVLVNARPRFPASGTCYAADLILTANHAVERDREISVVLPNASEVKATLVGRDPGSDLALLKLLEPAGLPAEKAPVDGRVGQFVLALGRPTAQTLEATFGVVSTQGGPIQTGSSTLLESYLRTDAIPYPGFSGGPLIDISGRVLGINSSGFGSGTSFTIPVSLAWRTAEAILRYGTIRRGYLGVQTQAVEISATLNTLILTLFNRSQARGLMLVSVEKGSPAAEKGLLVGDVLIGIDQSTVEDHDALLAKLGAGSVGKVLSFDLLRGGELRTFPIKIGERK